MRVYFRQGKKGGKWVLDYNDQDGVRHREIIENARTKKDAENFMAKFRLDRLNQELGIKSAPKESAQIGPFSDRYFKYVATVNKDMTNKSDRARFKAAATFFAEHDVRYLHQITRAVLDEFRAEYLETHSRASWNNVLNLLKGMISRAIEWEVIKIRPFESYRGLKTSQKLLYYSEDQLKNIIATSSEPMTTAIMILIHTGMRRTELFNLRSGDVDFIHDRIDIVSEGDYSTKNREIRSVPMSPALKTHLKKWLDRNQGPYVCRPYRSVETYRKNFKKILDELNYPGTIHTLRHTFASHMAMAGVPLPVLKELMGHATIETTMRYAHLSQESHRHAIGRLPYGTRHKKGTKHN